MDVLRDALYVEGRSTMRTKLGMRHAATIQRTRRAIATLSCLHATLMGICLLRTSLHCYQKGKVQL